ncbi:energy transducer TonB [Pedobacter sp. SYP-B3415]|uniref:energy transducer TonB n=1 Tax=Pedobacter sp. SYP-B3415 TaxID=2496641 RepID=UPI0013EBC20C|nr:energy transducer TonB [Pedobacter sp. SYP-B3415]
MKIKQTILNLFSVCRLAGVLMIVLSFSMLSTKAQQKKQAAIPYEQVDQKPAFPGGYQALYQYLAKELKYPEADRKARTSGKVVLSFVVDEAGKVRDVEVVKSVSKALDAEAVRVLAASPQWNPGKLNNEPISVSYQLPVTFNAGS